MNDHDKANTIKHVIKIISEDFDADKCGKHSDIHLSCISCQAAIVVSWLDDIIHLCYGSD